MGDGMVPAGQPAGGFSHVNSLGGDPATPGGRFSPHLPAGPPAGFSGGTAAIGVEYAGDVARPCGQPTKAGTVCKAMAVRGETMCAGHLHLNMKAKPGA